MDRNSDMTGNTKRNDTNQNAQAAQDIALSPMVRSSMPSAPLPPSLPLSHILLNQTTTASSHYPPTSAPRSTPVSSPCRTPSPPNTTTPSLTSAVICMSSVPSSPSAVVATHGGKQTHPDPLHTHGSIMKSSEPMKCQKSILVENATILVPNHHHHHHHHNTHSSEQHHIPYTPPSTRKCRVSSRWVALSFTTYLYIALIMLIMLSQFTQNMTMNKLVNIVRKQLSDTIVGEDDGGANNIRNGAVSIFASLGEVNGMKLGKSDDNKAMRNKEGKRNERFAKSKSGVGEKEVDVNEDDMAMNAPHMTFKFSNADKRLLRRHAITIDTSKPGVTVSSTIKTENLKKANMKTTTDKKKSVNMKRRAIIATVASYDIREMVRNLACFVSQTSQESKPIVFALDSALSKYLRKYKIPSIGFHASVQVKSANETKTAMRTSTQGRQRPSRDGVPAFWGTQKFSGISNNKLVVAYHLLRTGYDVLLTDVDVMWCRDMISTFTTFLHEYPKYDMFMQSNRPRENSTGQLNTGFYYAKSTSGVISLFESLSKHSPGAILRGQDDQTFFWGFMCRAGHPPTDGSKTGVLKYENGETSCQWNDGKVLLFFLPLMEFPNGAVRFNKEDGSRWSVHPAGFYRDKCKKQEVVMWHVNYVSASMKRHMMMTQDVWISRENGTCDTI